MDRCEKLDFLYEHCRNIHLILALVWICGLLAGAMISLFADDTLCSLMRIALCSDMSIAGLSAMLFLPFLISAFAVYISQPWLLILLAFLKAFVFAYTGAGVLVALGSAGWLVRLLLMFGDTLTLPMLWWYWQRILFGNKGAAFRSCVPALAYAAIISYLDFFIIAPFLASLI